LNPPDNRYPDGFTKCPSGKEIKNIAECKEVGLSVGGALTDCSNAAVGDWAHTLCGCFIAGAVWSSTKNIHFDTGMAG